MGRPAKPQKASIARLLPNAMIIVVNGEEITVPLDRQENAVANMMLAAQGRNLIQRALKHWKDQDEIPSPKELNDVTNAMKNLASFSAEVYMSADPVTSKDPKPTEQTSEVDVSFDDLSKITTVENGNDKDVHESPEAGSVGPAPSVQGEAAAG